MAGGFGRWDGNALHRKDELGIARKPALTHRHDAIDRTASHRLTGKAMRLIIALHGFALTHRQAIARLVRTDSLSSEAIDRIDAGKSAWASDLHADI